MQYILPDRVEENCCFNLFFCMASMIFLLLPVDEKSYGASPKREDNDQDDDLVKPDHGPAGGDGEGAVGRDGGDWKISILPY
jgi:hypothetical protein